MLELSLPLLLGYSVIFGIVLFGYILIVGEGSLTLSQWKETAKAVTNKLYPLKGRTIMLSLAIILCLLFTILHLYLQQQEYREVIVKTQEEKLILLEIADADLSRALQHFTQQIQAGNKEIDEDLLRGLENIAATSQRAMYLHLRINLPGFLEPYRAVHYSIYQNIIDDINTVKETGELEEIDLDYWLGYTEALRAYYDVYRQLFLLDSYTVVTDERIKKHQTPIHEVSVNYSRHAHLSNLRLLLRELEDEVGLKEYFTIVPYIREDIDKD